MVTDDTLTNAGIGAIVTLVLSFTGLSPILGGALAGYLQRETRTNGAKVGALSGAMSSIPFLFFGMFLFSILFGAPILSTTGGPVFFVIIIFLAQAFILWNVGLGALGGYLVVYLRDELATVGDTADSI